MSTPASVLQTKQSSASSRAAASRVQARLQVGRSHDGHEQEADRVAGTVVGSNHGAAGPVAQGTSTATVSTSSVQRAPMISRLADSAVQTRLQRREVEKSEEQEPEKVQRKE
ncbi:hypothetical protein bplSymb_SCF14201P005 [Bathymodiolus platifrons methanotrophic gill symbiont]|uniref:hypothetical protein n=1 Tax=Bathymodiolus platifrons methanotrophic gill symbiont TaxID=113268 RepID=UPI000B412DB5|nr:hypothetical protein [Bathymodiolus platifrons methanotrophic gill symbiont]GAW87713.1 hypothetical protein bplSymb_SCF14201P005 [Bathymodiolus platifrons methanotrophic gill symbiont]